MLNRLKSASREWPQVISPNIFKLKDIIFTIRTSGIITNELLIGLNKNQLKSVFFIKEQIF